MDNDPELFRVRRSHLVAALGLLLGLALGVAGTKALSPTKTVLIGSAVPASVAPSGVAVPVATAGSPAQGPRSAATTMVEFLDYQCPYCGRFFRSTLSEIRRHYGARIRFVVRNFPLTTLHPFAERAAEAAMCAFAQGRFWAYHDTLFSHQDALGVPDLERYAAGLGLVRSAFDRCLGSRTERSRVRHDQRAGTLAGVTATPTFFIDGQKLEGAQPYAAFAALLDRGLAASQKG